MNDRQIEELHKRLEAKGEVKVRQDLAKGIYNPTSTKVKLAEEWLKRKDNFKAEEDRNKEINIAKESNEIARESNQIAKGARNASRWALAISILALLVAIFKN